jgi:hypothetical protein
MDMIKFPIEFDSTGLRKLQSNSHDYFSQLLSVCLLTEPGIHPFTPNFGANDPAFRNIEKSVFIMNAAQFIPEVEVTNIDISSPDLNSGATRVSVSFNIKTAEG